MINIELNLKQSVVLVGVALLCAVSGAQGADATGIPTPKSSGSQAGGIPMGPLTAYPSVSYEVQRNDNIFLRAPGTGVPADTIQNLKPAVRLEGKSGASEFGVGVGADFGRYSDNKDDNYDNYNAFASVSLNPEARIRMKLKADHMDSNDPRGSTNDPSTATPSRYRQETLNGVFTFGATGAQGRFELEAGSMSKKYYNNRATTFVNDREETVLGGTFYWRVAPRTSLLAQVRRVEVDMSDPASRLNSADWRYFAGVTWEATAATTGIVKVGGLKKDFKDGTVKDESESSWDATIQWAPLTYSKWDFATKKETRETSGNFGSFVLGTNYSAKWQHAWTSQFSTTASASYAKDQYQGVARNDGISTFGLRASYQMRRWLSFGADINHQKRDSDVDTSDYKKNVLLLFVNATL